MEFDGHNDPGEEIGLPPGRPGSGNWKVTTPGGGRYRECLKNHAVGIGGHAVDGCGEFMPAGEEGTLDALRCAACNCHRNFHRKELDSGSASAGAGGMGLSAAPGGAEGAYHHHQFSPYYRTPAGYLHHQHHLMAAAAARAPAAPLALPSTSGGGAHSRGDEDELLSDHPMGMEEGGAGGLGASGSGSGKKRFRTRFTPELKEKMLALAERVGWRIQKHDEGAVEQFCNESGVRRHVLKVWMHNNKHTLGKKP